MSMYKRSSRAFTAIAGVQSCSGANGCLAVLSLDLAAWAAPTSTPGEMRQYRRELHTKIDALPYDDGPPSSTPITTESVNAEPIDSDDEPLN